MDEDHHWVYILSAYSLFFYGGYKKSRFFTGDKNVSKELPSLDVVLPNTFLLTSTSKDLYPISPLNFYSVAPLSLSAARTNESSLSFYGRKTKKKVLVR